MWKRLCDRGEEGGARPLRKKLKAFERSRQPHSWWVSVEQETGNIPLDYDHGHKHRGKEGEHTPARPQ